MTALQELIEKIESNELLGNKWKEKFLEKEKQQISEAVTYGNQMEFYDATEEAGFKYYEEISKK